MNYLEAIKRVVAQEFRCHVAALSAYTREEPIATARTVAIALCRELTGVGKSDIAEAFDRSPSLVAAALTAVNARAGVDRQFAGRVATLRQRCEAELVTATPPRFVHRREARHVPARRLALDLPAIPVPCVMEDLTGTYTYTAF